MREKTDQKKLRQPTLLFKQNSSSIQDPIKLENNIAVTKLGSKICSSQ